MKQRRQLPMYGVGPVYVAVILALTGLGLALSASGATASGKVPGLRLPFAVLGTALIAAGARLWHGAVFRARVDEHIRHHTLAVTGVYAWVRNPIYSAFMLACTGALLWAGDLWLLGLPPVFWLFLTVLMKHTEEKWLLERFGQAYADYCRRVNRCIPWLPRRVKEEDTNG